MKTTFLLTFCFFLTLGLMAAGKENNSYIKAGDQTYFGCDIHQGIFKTSIRNTEGRIVRVPNSQVTAIMDEDRLFKRMPVIGKDGNIVTYALMEYAGYRNGLTLYRYSCCNDPSGPVICDGNSYTSHYIYFVFRDGKFHLRVDAGNASSVLPFFGISVMS